MRSVIFLLFVACCVASLNSNKAWNHKQHQTHRFDQEKSPAELQSELAKMDFLILRRGGSAKIMLTPQCALAGSTGTPGPTAAPTTVPTTGPGKSYGVLTGTVKSNNKAVVGATVTCFIKVEEDSAWAKQPVATTDKNGKYSMKLPACVRAICAAELDGKIERAFYKNFPVRAGKTITYHFNAKWVGGPQPTNPQPTSGPKQGKLMGRVTNTKGKPVKDAQVTCYVKANQDAEWVKQDTSSGKTNEGGHYSLSLDAGIAICACQKDGYDRLVAKDLKIAAGKTLTRHFFNFVNQNGDDDDTDMTMTTVSGVVKGTNGAEVQQANIICYVKVDGDWKKTTTTTDSKGKYTLTAHAGLAYCAAEKKDVIERKVLSKIDFPAGGKRTLNFSVTVIKKKCPYPKCTPEFYKQVCSLINVIIKKYCSPSYSDKSVCNQYGSFLRAKSKEFCAGPPTFFRKRSTGAIAIMRLTPLLAMNDRAQPNTDPISCPIYKAGTKIDKSKWMGVITKSGSQYSIDFNIPMSAGISKYRVSVAYSCQAGGRKVETLASRMIVVFNPYNPADDFYVASQESRRRYLHDETGFVWVGTYKPHAKPAVNQVSQKFWNFDQFNKKSLLVALRVLDAVPWRHKGNALVAARLLSRHGNSMDDTRYGILVGRWDGKYGPGVYPRTSCPCSPTTWVGSRGVIDIYHKTLQPVQYGQCWVFAGLVTSLSRALGMPSRIITNFESAHEHHPWKGEINYFFNDKGQEDKSLRQGSVWNFHVWNEIWMRRRDLNYGHHWNAIDATPQENNGGRGYYEMGPASKKDILAGKMNAKYETGFVISEVSAAVKRWVPWKTSNGQHPNKPQFYLHSKANEIGTSLLTQGTKDAPKSELLRTYKSALFKKRAVKAKDTCIRWNFSSSGTKVGDRLMFSYVGHNRCKQARTVKVWYEMDVTEYTGKSVAGGTLKKGTKTIKILPNRKTTIRIIIRVSQYMKFLNKEHSVKASISSHSVEDDAWDLEETAFVLNLDKLNLQVPTTVQKKAKQEWKVAVKNPFRFVKLTNCMLICAVPGGEKVFKINQDLSAFAMHTLKIVETITNYHKNFIVGCVFHTSQVSEMDGVANVQADEEDFDDEDDGADEDIYEEDGSSYRVAQLVSSVPLDEEEH